MNPYQNKPAWLPKLLANRLCILTKICVLAALMSCKASAVSSHFSLSQVPNFKMVYAIAASDEGLIVIGNEGLVRLKEPTKILAKTVSPDIAPIAAFGGIGFAHQNGRFCLAKNQMVCSSVVLSSHSNLLWHQQAVFTTDQDGHLNKITQNAQGFVVQKSPITLLPDAQIFVKNGVLFALGEPSLDYRHGVLGDGVEAKTLYAFDEHLTPIDQVRATGGLVFEANRVDVWKDQLVTVMSGDGLGARIVLIGFDGRFGKPRQSQALSVHRWQSPFVFDGELYSVQMPHIQGDLVRFDWNLQPTKVSDTAFSNHAYGSHITNLALTQHKLVIPTLDRKALVVMTKPQTVVPLVARVRQSVYDNQSQKSYFVLENGQLWVLEI